MKGVAVRLARSAGRPASLPVPALTIASLAIATVVGVGCRGGVAGDEGAGGGTSPSGALLAVRTAASATLSSPAGVRLTLAGAHAFGSSQAPVLGQGEFDFRSGSGSESIDLGETGSQEPGNEQVVFLPSRVYLQPKAPAAAVLPKGKEWVSATLAGSESVSTNFPSFALQAEAINPQLLLTEIAGGAVAASAAPGRGDHATGGGLGAGRRAMAYDVTVDLPSALAALSGPSAPVLGEAIRSELQVAEHATLTAWIDRGRVVKLEALTPGAGAGMATMKICCFGEPVAVVPPAPARTVDIASLTPSGERENNGGGDSDGG